MLNYASGVFTHWEVTNLDPFNKCGKVYIPLSVTVTIKFSSIIVVSFYNVISVIYEGVLGGYCYGLHQ